MNVLGAKEKALPCVLLLQRTQVQFSASTLGGSQLLYRSSARDPTPLAPSGICTNMHIHHSHIHIIKNENRHFIIMSSKIYMEFSKLNRGKEELFMS